MTETPMDRTQTMIKVHERLAIVENRTETLEKTLPRIGKLEAGVAALSTRIEGVSKDIHEIQQDGHRTVEALGSLQSQHSELSHKISKLFWTGAGAMTLVAAVATVVSFIAGLSNIDGWIDRELASKREAREEARR